MQPLMQPVLRDLAKVLLVVLAVVPTAAWASATSCLTGTDPIVADDASQIRAIRMLIDGACPCASYDGTMGHQRGDYGKCAKNVMTSEVEALHLRIKCAGVVKKLVKASTCGVDPRFHARPCVFEKLKDGHISCKVVAATKKDGTPNDKCVPTTKVDAAACPSHTHCIDAADTNGDLLIAAPGDSGACAGGAVTIYDIKTGTVPVGSDVAVIGALVTAHNANGFFLQVKETDSGYAGPDFSGVFVFDPANTVSAGNRVSLSTAHVSVFGGQIQLTAPTVVVTNGGAEALPAPVVESPANVATGGARAAALESVIVAIENVAVTDVAPPLGSGDAPPSNEFVVDGVLRINDLFYLVSPFPTVSAQYASLTGILDLRNGDSKLEPRGSADVVSGPPQLVGFAPALSYVREGESGVTTFPTGLVVTLSHAPTSDTFVAVGSSDVASLTVVGGGATVLTGQTSATVLVDGLQQSAGVTLTAALGATSLPATVRVLGASEQPVLTSLTPATTTVAPGGTRTFTVGLDIPAPAGGTAVSLALTPASAGTIPPNVVVAANELSATFDYVDGGTDGSMTIDATLGANTLSAAVTIAPALAGLVINEIDYDNVGTDGAEFVEIYNGTGAPVGLTGLAVVLVNGSTSGEYDRFDLGSAGTLPPGQYLVVGSSAAVSAVPSHVLRIDLGAVSNLIQNGAPDGVALIDTVTQSVIDALSYEGAITSATITGLPPVSLVEGTALAASVADSNTASGALGRLPNGTDTNNASNDWKFTGTSTPGAANVP